MFLSVVVCFIACHGGPADHFSTFTEELTRKGYHVQIYATGPALKKCQKRGIQNVVPFSLENISEQEAATELAKKCSCANVIITDVGHVFDVILQKALQSSNSTSLRFAYYDNPEGYVPGGYSAVAAQVMRAAQKVLFANANLVEEPLYQEPFREFYLPPQKKIGLGNYPIHQAEHIAQRRASEQSAIRAQLFSTYSLTDQGQKVLVYAGGNNEEYFSKALPVFLTFLQGASQQEDLSRFVVLLQQHPGAKEKNVDDAQVVADGMLYYQTSMGPQFVLAGIPTIQVGHHTYEDILVKNRLCSIVTNVDSLKLALARLQEDPFVESGNEAIMQGLGIRPDWANRLECAMKKVPTK